MRIAIDARLNAYRQGGIPQYTRQLLAALADVSQEDEFISLQHRDQLRPLAIAPNVARRTAWTPPHHRFEQWALPLELLLTRAHVLHCPDFIAPVRRPCPAVVTIHDLAFMHYPEILDDAASAYYGQVKTNAPRADAIIAVSEATRQDIAQFLDIPIEQIDVIYEAAAPLYTRLELRPGEARVLNSTPVEADTFMLFVSTLEPRKNLPTLLQALRICLDRKPDVDYRLVVVGRRGWRDEAIFETVSNLKLGNHVLFAGGVGQYDLRWLYNACRMYINPSLYEGFGLPLLEAMACGAACLAAATSSLPEIGGDAALYVPPLDAGAWADEIEALWDDQDRRAELGRMGVARAQRFSWLRAARETLGVYKRAADRIVPAAQPAQMREMFAELPAEQLAELPIGRQAIPVPGGPRVCLRCGAEMSAGKLQHQLGMQPVEELAPEQVLAPRLWACPRCGHVELVVDWAVPLQPDLPTIEEAGAPAEAAATNGMRGEHDTLADTAVLAEIEPDAQHAATAAAPIEQDTAEPLADEPQMNDIQTEQAVAPAEAPIVDAAEQQLMPPTGADDTLDDSGALADIAATTELPELESPLLELPATEASAFDAQAQTAPTEQAPADLPADLPLLEVPSLDDPPPALVEADRPMAEAAVGDPAMPSSTLNGYHSDDVANGTAPPTRKPNARGASQAQPAPKEAAQAGAPKRRQSRSKRK